jgi:predicted TIM-barrel fold metal-dependent hydrolase
VGFSSNHVFAIEDEARRAAVLQIYNDFFVDLQRAGQGRLFPQAMLPIWNMDLTVWEMTRLIEVGITGFTLSDRPELLGLPELADPYFAPMWDLFDSAGVVANFHIGAGARREDLEAIRNRHTPGRTGTALPRADAALSAAVAWGVHGPQRYLAALASQNYMSNVRVIVNLCLSNLFDRYPNLKIVSAESGIGWVPFMLEAMEYQFDEMVTDPAELAVASRRPAEYFHDHISVMFWFEKSGPTKLIEEIGVNNVLLETDIPHPTCLYPDPLDHFVPLFEALDSSVVRRVVQDNAVELYRIVLPRSE